MEKATYRKITLKYILYLVILKDPKLKYVLATIRDVRIINNKLLINVGFSIYSERRKKKCLAGNDF